MVDGAKNLKLRNTFVLAYLAVQLTLPLRGFLRDKVESRGNFSWNMYSQLYGCEARFVLVTPGGRGIWLDQDEYSSDPERISSVFRRDWLPKYTDWLCARVQREGLAGQVKARVRCQHDLGSDVELVEPYTTICTVPE